MMDKHTDISDQVFQLKSKTGVATASEYDVTNYPLIEAQDDTQGPGGDISAVSKLRTFLADNALLLLTVGGVVIGFVAGFSLRATNISSSVLLWTGMPGELYMRSLKAAIVPLIVSSVITGTASMDPKSNGRVGAVATAYVITTNLAGVIFGLVLFYTFNKPGETAQREDTVKMETQLQTEDILADMIRNLMPDNIITATFEKAQTIYTRTMLPRMVNGTEIYETKSDRDLGVVQGTNILGLIIVCAIVGMATSMAREAGQPFMAFFKSTSEVIMAVLRWLIWFTPIGVASMIARAVADVDDLGATFSSLGMFVVAVTVGMFVLTAVLVPAAYFLLVRRSPLRFLYTALRPFMTAFATTSSAVTIPEMLTTCEIKHDVPAAISRFFIPFASALDRTGSCIYITMASLVLSRMEGVELEGVQILQLIVLCLVGSLAIPAVPSGSIICVLIILSSIGVTTTNVGLLMTLEWLLDRLRTVSNVGCMIFGAIFLHACCKSHLKELEAGNRDMDGSESAARPGSDEDTKTGN